MAAQIAKVLPATRHLIRFRYNANPGWNSPPPGGYHLKQLLMNGAVVWEEDVAATKPGWQEAEVDVTSQVRDETTVTVAFRLLEKKGVGNYGAHWRLWTYGATASSFHLVLTTRRPGKSAGKGHSRPSSGRSRDGEGGVSIFHSS